MEEIQIKLKPWGKEIWFANTESYAGKILEIMKGHRYSLQYHEKKTETQYVYTGKVRLTYGKDRENLEEKILEPGEKFHIPPNTLHRVEALEDSKIFEVSTSELDDVVKLHDDYGREGKGRDDDLDFSLHNQNQ
ncbi:MAG: cupin domain-containing protein [Candidatus Gracilibacteria bacterium]|jgi:quercetin dioxygenase-like cupin family protein|nr:cupin domain-containing protein [Candidatus Gracilibacteria bacterium]